MQNYNPVKNYDLQDFLKHSVDINCQLVDCKLDI